jgi:RNA polymerase sigma-70 factor (ECF subfamily)
MSARSTHQTRDGATSPPREVRARFRATSRVQPANAADEELIASLATGDEIALGQLYDRFGGIAYGLAKRIVRDGALAEEAVQEAFLSVWRSAGRFDETRGSARSWVLMLVHRRAVDLVKRQARHPEAPLEVAPEPAGSAAAEEADLRAERRRVQAALEALPPAQRRVIELGYYGGFSQSEIGRHLDAPLGTIKSRMSAGLSTLRDILSDSTA